MLRAEVLLWLFICLCVTGCFGMTRLMNGEETSIETFPYVAGLEKWNKCVCGASILSDTWALTAKHCISGDEVVFEVTLRVGSSYRESEGWVILVDDYKVHPDRPGNDIALLHTAEEFPFGDKVKAVLLPFADSDVKIGEEGTILGWGRTGQGQPHTAVLNKVDVVITAREKCKRAAQFPITKSIVCAKSKRPGSDSCRGDSGGPMMIGDVQIGIISRASCTGHAKAHILFTSVAHFRNWMEEQMC